MTARIARPTIATVIGLRSRIGLMLIRLTTRTSQP